MIIDYFFPGIDLLEYYLKRNNISVFEVALMHGGSFTFTDNIFIEHEDRDLERPYMVRQWLEKVIKFIESRIGPNIINGKK